MRCRQELLLLLVVGWGSVAIGLPHGLDSAVRFCGSSLTDVVQLVCRSRGGVNGPGPAAAGGGGRRHGGIASECCKQPCSWRTIISYCANNSAEDDSRVEPSLPQNEDEFDNQLVELLFGPIQPPKRRTKKSGCPKCTCKRTRKFHNELLPISWKSAPDRNRLSNSINVGTVPPDLARPPVVVRNL